MSEEISSDFLSEERQSFKIGTLSRCPKFPYQKKNSCLPKDENSTTAVKHFYKFHVRSLLCSPHFCFRSREQRITKTCQSHELTTVVLTRACPLQTQQNGYRERRRHKQRSFGAFLVNLSSKRRWFGLPKMKNRLKRQKSVSGEDRFCPKRKTSPSPRKNTSLSFLSSKIFILQEKPLKTKTAPIAWARERLFFACTSPPTQQGKQNWDFLSAFTVDFGISRKADEEKVPPFPTR